MCTHITIVLYPSYTAPQEQCGCEHTLKYDTTISLIHWQFNQQNPLALTQDTTQDTAQDTVHRTLMTVDSPTWGWQLLRKCSSKEHIWDTQGKVWTIIIRPTHCTVFSSILWLNFVAVLKEHMCWRERQDGCPPEQSKDTGHDTRQETPP